MRAAAGRRRLYLALPSTPFERGCGARTGLLVGPHRRGLATSAPPGGSSPSTTTLPVWSRQWLRRGIGLGLGLAALAGFSAAAYTSQWELGDRGRWVVARVGAHQLVRALRWSHPAVLPQVLPAIAHLSTSIEGANELAAHNVLNILCRPEIGLSPDPHIRFYAAMIISNMLKADRRMLSQLSLDEANRYVAGVIAIEREQQGPFASSVQLYITRILTTLFASEEPREAAEVLLAVGLSTVSDLTAPWPGTTQAVEGAEADYQAFYHSLASAIAQLSIQPEHREELALRGGLALLYLAVQRTSANRDVIEHAARCIANVAVNENLSEAIMSEGGLEILDMARGLGPASPQLCRAIANLAKSELCKDRLVSLGWLRQIRNWLMSPDPNMQITGLAALANLASPAMNGLDFVNEIAAQVGLEPLKRLIDEFPKHGPRPASAKQWMLSEMLLRAVANIVVHDRFAEELSKAVAERGVLALLSQRPIPPYSELAIKAAREAARALANMAAHEHLAPTVLALHRSELIELAQLEDLVVREQTARALANLASYRPEGLQEDIRIEAILNSWLQSPESTIKSNAVRALASITFATLSGAKYGEGVHLLYPGLDALTDPEKAKEFSRDHQYDIVFLHGVTGHPFTTWASGNGIEDDEAEGFECWPREWLPEDLPHSGRIISVAFDLYLSGWFGEGEPASHYAVKILRSLKMAAVGSKPVVFVVHSFGGLIVKEILRLAEQDPKARRLLQNTVGVVFYSTPHSGVEHVAWSFPHLHHLLFRANPALDDLHDGSEQLLELNRHFATAGSHISTLSFGEEATCFGTRFNCYQVVDDDSANPHLSLWRRKFDTRGEKPNRELAEEVREEGQEPLRSAEEIERVFAPDAECGVRDEFFKTEADHLQVCKPKSKEDPRYRLTLAFIRYALRCRRPAYPPMWAYSPFDADADDPGDSG